MEEGNNAYGCVKQLFLLKKHNRGVKTLLSIGGWTYSANFTTAASTEASRLAFARTSVTLMKNWGFDGIDVDWEYPVNAEEAANFVLLLKAVRHELDGYAEKHSPEYHYLLTIASPAGPEHYTTLNLGGMSTVVDYFYLMGYDYAGAWDRNAAHQANLYADPMDKAKTPFSTDAAVSAYLRAGVPAWKIVLGMPIYGRDFLNTTGIGQLFSDVGEGSWERGVWDYKVLPQPGATIISDDVNKHGASYSYDSERRVLVSYDTPEVVKRKVVYIKEKGLGGSMFWEASGDKKDEGSLISTSFEALGAADMGDSQNQLVYPDSVYDNIRDGMA
jgi:chitinase